MGLGSSCDSVCGDGGMTAVMTRRMGPIAPEEWRALIIEGDRTKIHHWYKKELSLAKKQKKLLKKKEKRDQKSKKKVGFLLADDDDDGSGGSSSGGGSGSGSSTSTGLTSMDEETKEAIGDRLEQLDRTINASLFEYGGINALHYTILKQNKEVLDLLILKLKVDVNKQMKITDSKFRNDEEFGHLIGQRKSPIHLAVSMGNMYAIDLLCRNGANLLVEDKNGCLPSTYADSTEVLNFLTPFEEDQQVRAEEEEKLLQQTNWHRDLGVSLQQMAQYWDKLSSDEQFRLWIKSSMSKRELEAMHRKHSKKKKSGFARKGDHGIKPPPITPTTLRTLIIKLSKEALLIELKKEYMENWRARQQKSTKSTRRLVIHTGSSEDSDDGNEYGDIPGDLASMIASPKAGKKKGEVRPMGKREKTEMNEKVNKQMLVALKEFVKQPATVFKEALDCIEKVINDELYMEFEREDGIGSPGDTSSEDDSSGGEIESGTAYESDTSEIIRDMHGIRGIPAETATAKTKGKKRGKKPPGMDLQDTITVTDSDNWRLPYDQFQIQFSGILRKVHQTLTYRRRNQVNRIKAVEMKKKSSFSMWTMEE